MPIEKHRDLAILLGDIASNIWNNEKKLNLVSKNEDLFQKAISEGFVKKDFDDVITIRSNLAN